MISSKESPYGEWSSALSPQRLTEGALRLNDLWLDGTDAYWVEGRADEGGRNVIVSAGRDGSLEDLLPVPFNARTRVHEYGGGAFTVHDGQIWFANDADQRLYTMRKGEMPRALTPAGSWRYADLLYDPGRSRLVCVREDHTRAGEPVNSLVSIRVDHEQVDVLAAGDDFYSSPVISADGRWLAYLSWNHPDMPWDATSLWVAQLDGSGLNPSPRKVAGGDEESIVQPAFSRSGDLYFVSDRDGWWNLYEWRDQRTRCIAQDRAEYAMPHWQFAMRCYGIRNDRELVCASTHDGLWRLDVMDIATGARRACPHALSALSRLAVTEKYALALVAGTDAAPQVIRWNLETDAVDFLRQSSSVSLSPANVSAAQSVDYATSNHHTAHGFFYQPRNAEHHAPAGQLPPLIVISHGGPTGATTAALSPSIQFWTTRGFAVLDVNYRGSTGYGRDYRNALRGGWGVVDVEDCVNGARHLADAGMVDPKRLIIRGSSAGGFTTLAALTFHDTFCTGASYYGIGELESLARDTHKFESRYLDRLIGPYPENAELYQARSPIKHVELLSRPVIFFQGLEDKVVPPDQAELMHKALKDKGIAVACLMFEGEQHGFRRAQTIIRALEAELAFYGRVLGFTPAGDLPRIHIDNLGNSE